MQLRGTDAIHRSAMYKILIAVADDATLSQGLIFKGGTCASLLGFLDRFSVDLDFDRMKNISHSTMKKSLESVFLKLSLPVVQKHPKVLMYRVKHSDDPTARKTIKISVNEEFVRSSTFEPQYLADIDRTMTCQTREAMVAHKFVALTGRYAKKKEIAGRDVYDIHEFLLRGYSYSSEIIKERTKLSPVAYIKKMIAFIQTKVTQRVIDEDLNLLLPSKAFQSIRKVIIPETLSLLRTELSRLT